MAIQTRGSSAGCATPSIILRKVNEFQSKSFQSNNERVNTRKRIYRPQKQLTYMLLGTRIRSGSFCFNTLHWWVEITSGLIHVTAYSRDKNPRYCILKSWKMPPRYLYLWQWSDVWDMYTKYFFAFFQPIPPGKNQHDRVERDKQIKKKQARLRETGSTENFANQNLSHIP